jgi:hypothetical protein
MMKKYFVIIPLIALLPLAFVVTGQDFERKLKPPAPETVAEAKAIVAGVFNDLEQGRSEKIASWIVDEIGYNWEASKKVQMISEYRSKLDIILLSPPDSPYGPMDGYDLLDEGFLAGTDRFFRLIYMTYHVGAPLIWEYRFYVTSGGELKLNYIGWSEDNPFEYMSQSDKLLTRFDEE